MATVSLRVLSAGYTTHPERVVIKDGRFAPISFPSSVGVIEHSTEGVALFDTGYSPAFFKATARFPERLYSLTLPVHLDESATAVNQLKAMGIDAGDVRRVFVSHFHGDHISGLGDFPEAIYIGIEEAFRHVMSLSRLNAVRNGFIRGLLPHDFKDRWTPFQAAELCVPVPGLGEGWKGIDVFGDDTVWGVPLPGHARGQMGVFVRSKKEHLLVADACWLTRSFQRNLMPSRITGLVHDDLDQYRRTLDLIHRLHGERPDLDIVPCHCEERLRRESVPSCA